MTDKTYTIAQLAEELGVTLRTIRFYEAKGLISPQRAGKARVYTHRDRARMILILRGKRMGFSLSEIKEFLDLYVVDAAQDEQMRHLLQKVRSRIEMLETQLQDVQTSLSELREVERATQTLVSSKVPELT